MDWSVFEREPGRSLERALLDNPDEREAWAVFADFIEPQLPVLAERILFELQAEASADEAERELWEARVQAFDLEKRGKWLDAGTRKLFDKHKRTAPGVELDWRYGFMSALRLQGRRLHARSSLEVMLRRVIDSPLARFLSAVTLDCSGRTQREREAVAALIRQARPREALRVIDWRDEDTPVSTDELLRWAPRVERLHVRGYGRPPSRRSESLRSLSLALREGKQEAPLRLPRLREMALECWRVPPDQLEELVGTTLHSLFEGAELGELRRMRVHVRYLHGDTIVYALRELELLRRLRVLEFPQGIQGNLAMQVLMAESQDRPLSLRLVVSSHELNAGQIEALGRRGVELVEQGYRDFAPFE